MKFYRAIPVWFGVFIAVFTLVANADVNDVNEPEKDIAVTVNGIDITEADLEKLMKPYLEKFSAQTPPQVLEQEKQKLKQQILEQEIVETLLEQKVKQAGITVTEQQVAQQLETFVSQQNPPMSLDDFKKLLETYGQTIDDIKIQIEKNIAYDKILEAQWPDKTNVTEEDTKKYYSENKSQFQNPEQVQASHILVKFDTSDPDIDEAEYKAKARAKAEKLLKQIKEDADFAELAKANSDCPSSQKGGDLGYFGKGQMVPPFEKAVFSLKVGQISDIVETRFGYHIIKLTNRKEPKTVSFDEAEQSIIQKLTDTEKKTLIKKYIELLKDEADIVYPPGKEPKPVTFNPMAPPVK